MPLGSPAGFLETEERGPLWQNAGRDGQKEAEVNRRHAGSVSVREPGEHHCDQEGNRQGGPLHRGLAAVHRCVASKDLERYGQKYQNYFLVAFGCCTTSLFKAILCQMRPAGPPRSVNFTHPQNSFSFHHAF